LVTLDGREGLTKILLKQEGVNPDRTNHAGRTPFPSAAANGNARVVEILLRREEVNPNNADNEGQTPRILASEHGHQSVIELLQAGEAVAYSALFGLGDTTSQKSSLLLPFRSTCLMEALLRHLS